MAEVSEVIRVFISSKQREFVEERQGMADIIRRLPLLAIDAAGDWASGRDTIETTHVARVRTAPIYVGLFGCTYSAPTVHEYETALENPHREVLVYVKRCKSVDPSLAEFVRKLEDPHEGHVVKCYETWGDLRPDFERHLWFAVRHMIENYLTLSDAPPVARAGSGVTAARWTRMRGIMLGLGLPGAEDPEQARRWARRLDVMLDAEQT